MKQERPYYCGPASLAIIQRELGHSHPLSQHDLARLAGTTKAGTGPWGLKRALRRISATPRVIRTLKPGEAFKLAIVYDHERDHWFVVRQCYSGIFPPYNRKARGLVAFMTDPETGGMYAAPWWVFRERYLSDKRKSYAIVVTP